MLNIIDMIEQQGAFAIETLPKYAGNPAPLKNHQVGSENKFIVNSSRPGGTAAIQARMVSPSSTSTLQA
jgi:hypothetical protein